MGGGTEGFVFTVLFVYIRAWSPMQDRICFFRKPWVEMAAGVGGGDESWVFWDRYRDQGRELEIVLIFLRGRRWKRGCECGCFVRNIKGNI